MVSVYEKDVNGNDAGFTSDVVKGLSPQAQSDLMRNTVERNINELREAGYGNETIDAYRKKARQLLKDVNVGRYSADDYAKAEMSDVGGFYSDADNFISVNTGSHFPEHFVEKHEGRHLLDYKLDDNLGKYDDELVFGTDFDLDAIKNVERQVHENQREILAKAFDDDFVNLPNTEFAGSLKGYKLMPREIATTNRDARDVLLGKSYSEWDPILQNKLIDKMPDEKIFNAVEEANGYGRKFI